MNGRFAPRLLDLSSPLPRSRCVELLATAVGGYGSERPMVGRITPTTLVARKRINYRNSFQSQLTATLVDEGGGTRLRGRFGMHPVVLGFIGIWVLGVGSVAVAVVQAALAGHLDDWPVALIPFGMLAFMGVMVTAGRLIARSEQAFITEQLRQTIHAQA